MVLVAHIRSFSCGSARDVQKYPVTLYTDSLPGGCPAPGVAHRITRSSTWRQVHPLCATTQEEDKAMQSVLKLPRSALVSLLVLTVGLAARPLLAADKKSAEPTWVPYQTSNLFIPSSCTFNSVLYFCDVALPAVPAGQQLMVEHVSLFVAVDSGSPDSVRFLNSNHGTALWVQPVFTPRVNNPNHFFLDRSVTVYYTSGDTPHVLLALTAPLSSAEVTVHGKLSTAAN
jgi:hypothetical protein